MTRVRIDYRLIADAALRSLESLCGEWLPGGHREGHEYKALNPTRADSRIGSFSVNLNTGAWGDFATNDKGGDATSLLAYLHGTTQLEAARELAKRLGLDTHPVGGLPGATGGGGAATAATPRRRSEWIPVVPAPESADELPKAHIKRGKPEARWDYRGAAGELLGAVYRFRTSDGGKEVLPVVWARHGPTGAQAWRWLAFPQPRPLYGLDRLAADGTVLVVEGEKCADAAREVLPVEISVVTWPGGSNAVDKADWTPLANRKVIVWPDADAQQDKLGQILPAPEQPGIKAAERIASILLKLGAEVRIVAIPAPGAKPSGWDVADAIAEGWTADQVRAFVHNNLRHASCAIRSPASAGQGPTHGDAALPPQELSGDEAALLQNDKGVILACEHNALLLMRASERYAKLYYDEFRSRPRIGDRDLLDDDVLDALLWLQGKHRVAKFSLAQARNAVMAFALTRKRDSLKDFILRSLPAWDGVERIEMAFVDAWGAANTETIRAAARNFFIAMIARGLVPGAKVDTLWCFEGKQGIGKSMSLAALACPFHAELTAPVGSADLAREVRSLWLGELSELDSLRKSEATTVKKFISATEDIVVEKYQIYPSVYPRRAVLVATTNEKLYWQDPTGARRLIPVACSSIDIDLIKALRLQWFAEALVAYRAGATWWTYPAGLHEEQEGRQKVDPWEDELRRCMKEGQISSLGVSVLWPKDQWISSADLLRVWLRVPPHLQSSTFSTRLGQVMRALNYTNESKTNEGKLARGWSPPPAEAVAPPQPPEYTSPTHQGEVLTEVYARSSDEEVPF